MFNTKLNKLRRLEASKLEVPYLAISDPTPGNDLLFMNMFIQTLDQANATGSVVLQTSSKYSVTFRDRA